MPVTVIQAGPCTVTAVRTKERNGYSAVQLGFGVRKKKNVTKPILGQLKQAGLEENPPAKIREIRTSDNPDVKAGDKVSVNIFSVGNYVDVTGFTKGKGYQGVVKRYNFAGGCASHGSDWHRRTGSIGMCESPAKVYKGRKMPGQMGNKQHTVQGLNIVDVRPEKNLLLVKGAVPGSNNSYLIIRQAKKK